MGITGIFKLENSRFQEITGNPSTLDKYLTSEVIKALILVHC
jgi:hypothetical protein